MKRAVNDFLTTLFPLPSPFELPPGLRNRFLSLDELRQWEENSKANDRRRESIKLFVLGFLSLLALVALGCLLRERLLLRRRRRSRDDGIDRC